MFFQNGIFKQTVKCFFSVMLLTTCIVGLIIIAGRVSLEIDPPSNVKLENQLQGNKISWETVDYATSYRVYRRQSQGEWEQLSVVSSSTLSYLDDNAALDYEYAVKAYHLSAFGAKSLSDYSVAVKTNKSEVTLEEAE